MSEPTARELRVALAAAVTRGSAGAADRAEAVTLLERALREPGERPPDAEIHRRLGELLEENAPVAALTEYLDGATAGDRAAASGARRLLGEGGSSIRVIARQERWQAWARTIGTASEVCAESRLLAAEVMLADARVGEAAMVLRGVLDEDVSDPPAVVEDLLRLELLLGDVDGARALVDRLERAGGAIGSLSRARLALWQGDADQALAILEAGDPGVRLRDEAVVLEALCLLAKGDAPAALDRLETHPGDPTSQELLRARGVVRLSLGDHEGGKQDLWRTIAADSTSLDSRVLIAQVSLEALGTERADGGLAAPSEHEAWRADLVAEAREPLTDVAKALRRRTSRWLVYQDLVRRDDRYRFFTLELRRARAALAERPLSSDELPDGILAGTTLLQDAVLEDVRAECLLREGSDEAATAFRRAAERYAEQQVYVRAVAASRQAFAVERDPSHAAYWALAAYDLSYEAADAEQALPDVQEAADVLWGVLPELPVDEPSVPEVARALALISTRHAQLAPMSEQTRDRRLLAALAILARLLDPADIDLLVLVADALGDAGTHRTALEVAQVAARNAPEHANAVSGRVSALVNCDARSEWLEDLAAVAPDLPAPWIVALRLYVALVNGHVEELPALLEGPPQGAGWSIVHRALARVLVEGRSEAALAALKAAVAAAPPSDVVELACCMGDERLAESALSELRSTRDADEPAVVVAEGLMALAFREVPVAEVLADVLPACWHPSAVRWLWNVSVPLISGPSASLQDRTAAEAAVELRLSQIRDLSWSEELELTAPCLLGPVRLLLASEQVLPGEVVLDAAAIVQAAWGGAHAPLAPLVPQAVRSAGLAQGRALVLAEAAALASEAAGTPLPAASSDGLLGDHALGALAWLRGGDGALAALSEDDRSQALALLGEALTSAAADPRSWWRLQDRLGPRLGAVPELQEALLAVLGQLCGASGSPDLVPRQSLWLVLGRELVPQDTGPDWVLFRELLPRLRERLERRTGVRSRSFWVTQAEDADSLRLFVHGCPVLSVRVPTQGLVVRDLHERALADPLTGEGVRVSTSGTQDEADAATGWTALEFALRYVEAALLRHVDLTLLIDDVTSRPDLDEELLDVVFSSLPAGLTLLDAARQRAASTGLSPDALSEALRTAAATASTPAPREEVETWQPVLDA